MSEGPSNGHETLAAFPDDAPRDATPIACSAEGRSSGPTAPTVLNCAALPPGVPRGDIVYIGGGIGVPDGLAVCPQFATPFRDPNRSPLRARWLYEAHLGSCPRLADEARRLLRGKHLACWCAPEPCHGDVLLRVANPPLAARPAFPQPRAQAAGDGDRSIARVAWRIRQK